LSKSKGKTELTPLQLSGFWRLLRGGLAMTGGYSEEVAAQAKMSWPYLRNIAAGAVEPTSERAWAIVDALKEYGVELDPAKKSARVLPTAKELRKSRPKPKPRDTTKTK
jgi:hypothetical protein